MLSFRSSSIKLTRSLKISTGKWRSQHWTTCSTVREFRKGWKVARDKLRCSNTMWFRVSVLSLVSSWKHGWNIAAEGNLNSPRCNFCRCFNVHIPRCGTSTFKRKFNLSRLGTNRNSPLSIEVNPLSNKYKLCSVVNPSNVLSSIDRMLFLSMRNKYKLWTFENASARTCVILFPLINSFHVTSGRWGV